MASSSKSHPNATASVLTGGTAGLVIYVLGRLGVHDLSATDGAYIVTAGTAVVLFIGRRGIRGTLAALWGGSSPPDPPMVNVSLPPVPPPPDLIPPAAVGLSETGTRKHT